MTHWAMLGRISRSLGQVDPSDADAQLEPTAVGQRGLSPPTLTITR